MTHEVQAASMTLMTRSLRIMLFFALVASCALHASCRDAVRATTGPTEVTLTTAHFSGSLSPGAGRFYSFTVSEPGSVTVLLASVTAPGAGTPLNISLGLGFGIPRGTGCGLIQRVDAAPALIAQLVHSVSPGVYCVEVADIGQAPSTVNFATRFTYP
jgi:hypothetical protein